MNSRKTADSNFYNASTNLKAYKEILTVSEELRSIFESDDGSGKRLWQLLNLIRVDVDRILKASADMIKAPA